MFVETNANPYNANIDDCLLRAITLATGKPYFDVFDDMIAIADHNNWNIDELRTGIKYLNDLGWDWCDLDRHMTVKQYAQAVTEPRIVIVNGHATFTKDGNTYDTWNCNRYHVKYVFKKCE